MSDQQSQLTSSKRKLGSSNTSNQKRRKVENEKFDLESKLLNSFKEGPLKLLVTCFAEKSKVKVYVRNAKGLRGSCTGTIIAFDKQMNLILKNVNEEYIETEVHFKKQTLPDGTKKKRKRKTFVEVKKQRFISQLFIKGDSIVSICRLEK